MSRGLARIDVECDGCRKVESVEAEAVEIASQRLDVAGWLRNGSRDQDLCPDCFYGRTGFNVPGRLL